MSDISEEISQMIRTFDSNANVGELETEAPSTEEPAVAAATDAPSTEEPTNFNTEPPSTEEPSTEAPSTEAPEEDERDKRIAELEAKLAEREKASTKAPSTEAPVEVSEQDFIGDLDVEELTQDSEEFNKLLNKIYQQAVKDTEDRMGKKFDQAIPELVKENLTTMTNLQKASEDFFKDNEDLEPFRKVVSTVFEELATENPNKNYGEIMKDVATESRKRLGLDKNKPKPKQEKEDKKPPRPPSKKGRSGRGEEPKQPDPLQSELEEMNKTLRR